VTPHHELLYVLEGKFTLTLAGGLQFPAVAGDFKLVPAHIPHRDVFEPSRGLRLLMLQFEWEETDEYFAAVTNRTLCDLDFTTRSEAMRRIDFMREHWDDSETGIQNANIQLHALLLLFYNSAARTESRSSSPVITRSRSDVMRQMKFYLTQNYASAITLEQLSRRFEISSAYLSRLFHREYGVGFYSYLTAIRLEAAQSLLGNTNLQIAEVALRCGFSDSSHFIKVFRRHFGTTPMGYRRGERSGTHAE